MLKFHTTADLAERCKLLTNRKTTYALAKLIGITPQSAANWLNGITVMEDNVGLRVAQILNLDPDEVLMSLQIERIQRKGDATVSRAWQRIAKKVVA